MIRALLIFDASKTLRHQFYHLDDISILYRWKIKASTETTATEILQSATFEKHHYYKIPYDEGSLKVTIYGYSHQQTYLLLADPELPEMTAFRYLYHLQKLPLEEETLQNFWNHPDPIHQMQEDLEETRVILLESIDKLMDRGEHLDRLLTQTEHLSKEAYSFNTRSKSLNRCCALI